MAKITKTELCKMCGKTSNWLAVYVKRGKVIVDENDDIDLNDLTNSEFVKRYSVKNSPSSENKAESSPDVTLNAANNVQVSAPVAKAGHHKIEIDLDDPEWLSNIPELKHSERLLKYLETQKKEQEIIKLELDIAKRRGELVPSAFLLPIFKAHNQSILTAYKQAADTMINKFAQMRELNVEEIAEVRGFFYGAINEAMEKAVSATANGIENVINQFAVKKGVGEKE